MSVDMIPFPKMDFEIDHESKTNRRLLSKTFGSFDSLPTIKTAGIIPHIHPETLTDIVSGKYNSLYDRVVILDCRFGYEYEGGHIKDAIHIDGPETLKKMYFTGCSEEKSKTVFIFHCEFSQNRGPSLAAYFRKVDREINIDQYPKLTYPNVYILDGGYKRFYSEYPEYCIGGYTKMLDKAHKSNGDLQASMAALRKSMFVKQIPSVRGQVSCPGDLCFSKRCANSPLVAKLAQSRLGNKTIPARHFSFG